MKNPMNSQAYINSRKKACELLEKMTLTEKIGQLSQFGTSIYTDEEKTFDDHYAEGKVGSYLTIKGAERTNSIQRSLLNATRLNIPALFADDVIHGYRTTFPTPLAQSCSWNPEVTRKCCEISAKEAYRAGIKWTFSPMVDIARDPRWGRIVEGYGEDTYLTSEFAKAAVLGYQGDSDEIGKDHIYACMKHYIAYGACIGGRDYNSTDLSLETLHDVYLPPFKAGIDAGAATVMSAFEDINGVPATANKYWLKKVLRDELDFRGFVVSDAGAVTELIPHGFAKDVKDAVKLSFNAGCDMVMAGDMYNDNIPALIDEDKISMEDVDKSVLSILTLKYLCGLMESPYVDENGEDCFFSEEHLKVARESACECAVLLENDGILPLNKEKVKGKKIALIGALAGDLGKRDLLGNWSCLCDPSHTVSIEEGLKKAYGGTCEINTYYGCGVDADNISNDDDYLRMQNDVNKASQNDIIIAVMGEDNSMSGEASSRSNIELTKIQREMLNLLIKTNKPVILLVASGRPIPLTEYKDKLSSIMMIWQMGSEVGNAVADLLIGNTSPSGRLSVSVPATTGQVPIYYNHNNTGRPPYGNWAFESKYRDCQIAPLYPFGYGLGYSEFKYENVKISDNKVKADGHIDISLDVKNVGEYDGYEVIELYVRDLIGSRVRPVKELRGFKKVFVKANSTLHVDMRLNIESLAFHDQMMNLVIENGDFKLYIAKNSADEEYTFDFSVE